MNTRATWKIARRATPALLVIAVAALLGVDAVAQEQNEPNCPPLLDPPLSSLSVDIRPVAPDGQLLSKDDLPDSCWTLSGMEGPATFIGCTAGGCVWDCHCVLQLARFCHPRVYFEDAKLERCGQAGVFPNLRSASKFLTDLTVLPVKLVVNYRDRCVRTPTPYCCPP